ncbi:putative endo-1,3(4)-beta-glucanase, partial [Pseudocercospora fuligena]
MAGLRSCTRIRPVLSLIALLQVPLASAHPYYLDPPRHGRPLPPGVYTITSTSCDDTVLPTPTTTVQQLPDGQPEVPASQGPNVIYQIEDGQIQAPHWGHPEQAPLTTESSSTSTTTSTSRLTARDATTSIQPGGRPPPYNNAASSFSTSVPDNSLTSLTTSEVQSASSTELAPTSTSGSVISSLETSGQPSSQPFATSTLTNATVSLSLVDTATLPSIQPTATSAVSTLSASEIFQPIASDAPKSLFNTTSDHPVPRTGIEPQSRKLQTNKFYSGLYLDQQTSPAYTLPYAVSWSKGKGQMASWGLSITHTERYQWANAPATQSKDAGKWAFFGAPVGIQHVVLSALQLGIDPNTGETPGLTTDSMQWGSVKANLYPPGWMTPVVSFPLLQGTPFITAEYHWAQPYIESSVGFATLTFVGAVVTNTTYKYRTTLRDNTVWLIYVTPADKGYKVNKFDLHPSGANITGTSLFNGVIQVAKIPTVGSIPNTYENQTVPEAIYDASAGAYPVGINITGSVNNKEGSYTLSWTKKGVESQSLLMFALPHHVASMSYPSQTGLTVLQLRTTTKGVATAVTGDSWTLKEDDLPIDMGFAPWTPSQRNIKTLSNVALQAINNAGAAELQQNITAQADSGSAYYDGKALAKFAALIYTLHEIGGDKTLALTGLQKLLKPEFARHINGEQIWPFWYESAWGGIVSSASYRTGQPLEDFGNTYYNDHHFHYGYFVYAAAVIGYLDPTWLQNSTNVAWVNMLIRDYANSDLNDPSFPFSRNFDFWHGHSWAAGLFDSGDGKNQESSSEDTMSTYAIKMWGRVINDAAMEARGNLMLAIQARSMQSYYLYTSDNKVEPQEFIGNKAAGILFENKIDHTTYFGANVEYIQGIHMIPIMPFSTYIRTPQLVSEEWSAYFSNKTNGTNEYIDGVQGGWKGLLMANFAMANESAARETYDFFADPGFDMWFLDGGAREWSVGIYIYNGLTESFGFKRGVELQRQFLRRQTHELDFMSTTEVPDMISTRSDPDMTAQPVVQ